MIAHKEGTTKGGRLLAGQARSRTTNRDVFLSLFVFHYSIAGTGRPVFLRISKDKKAPKLSEALKHVLIKAQPL